MGCGHIDFAPAGGDAATTDADTHSVDAADPVGPWIAAGGISACATTTDGTLYCWGNEPPGDGQADGTHAVPSPVPGLPPLRRADLHGARYVVDETGGLWVWGGNTTGQLGDGTTSPGLVPRRLDLGGPVRAASSGYAFGCALRVAGTVACWGDGSAGKLGNGGSSSSLVPVEVVGLADAITLESGDTHSCAVRADGTAVCWGDNGAGQLGVPDLPQSDVPVVVASAPGPFDHVAVGDTHACGRLRDGTVACWGSNSSGQLGVAAPASSSAPLRVPGVATVVMVVANAGSTCVLHQDGTASCWGSNTYAELGDGTHAGRSAPAPVPGLTDLVSLSGRAGLLVCALDGAGQRWCWGSNNSGALALDPSMVDSPVPVLINLPP
jgi:alpha-tubulin suppressor-like RCC1 family protein